MRNSATFFLEDLASFKKKALQWAEQFSCFQYLNGNGLAYHYGTFPCLLAVANRASVVLKNRSSDTLDSLLQQGEWQFGYLGYEYANTYEYVPEEGFGLGEWFRPETILFFDEDQVRIESESAPDEIFSHISTLEIGVPVHWHMVPVPAHSKESYVETIDNLKKHLLRGNIYQVNFCTRFVAEQAVLHPVQVYEKLNTLSPTPFSALLKLGEKYIICASPERYLKRMGAHVLSQPMKGTAPRGKNEEEDVENALLLQRHPKERAENIMIVDLVRNDLSKVCQAGSVHVSALCEVRSFGAVHQMISTVEGLLPPEVTTEQLIQATFPMGSMTGAPKIRAMELIREFEGHPRGPFSGTLGYVKPNGDFDLNVLIRSIFYNTKTKQLTYSVGSGVTVLSDAEKEYEECLLKAQAIAQILNGS